MQAAIGWSKDKAVWCVVCPERAGFGAAQCRVAEELHLFDGLTSPLAKDAGVRVEDRGEETLEEMILYRSELGPEGARHEALARHVLSGAVP